MAEELPEPKNRKEEFLANIAGMDVELPEPANREEIYLNAIAENGGGGGGSYTAGDGITIADDTISVDTTTIQEKLTAGNNITIADDTISATDTTYSNFTGTDGQTAGTAGLVPAPATTDADKYLKADGTWDTVSAGGITVLTSADYNWNSTAGSATEPYDCIAPWLLPEGVYAFNSAYVVVYPYTNQTRYNDIKWMIAGQIPTTGDRYAEMQWGTQFYRLSMSYSGGSISSTSTNALLTTTNVINNLTSTSTTSPLAANQGRALKDLIDSLVIKNAGAPTTSTVGTVGKLYEDTTNGKLYQCTAIDTTDPQNPVYTWTEVGGSGGPTVVQTIGDSTTDVMSQNAVTNTIFADHSSQKVRIGDSAISSNTWTIGIGYNAWARGPYSVTIGANARTGVYNQDGIVIGRSAIVAANNAIALGHGASAQNPGEMNIGTPNALGSGYKSSSYRLISGVYDGESDHDAATYGQMNTRLGGLTLLSISQTDYDALATKDPNTLYVITGA